MGHGFTREDREENCVQKHVERKNETNKQTKERKRKENLVTSDISFFF